MSADRFEQIINEINSLAIEAEELVPPSLQQSVQSYWFAQLMQITDNDHIYVNSCGVSMPDTLEEMRVCETEDEEPQR